MLDRLRSVTKIIKVSDERITLPHTLITSRYRKKTVLTYAPSFPPPPIFAAEENIIMARIKEVVVDDFNRYLDDDDEGGGGEVLQEDKKKRGRKGSKKVSQSLFVRMRYCIFLF